MSDDENIPKGRQKGGIARAEALSASERQMIARRGALARWGAKATHRGNFKEEFGIDVDCYVLDDEQKMAVISQRGMGAALGFSEGGSRLTRFVNSATMAEFIGPELRAKLEKPIVFQGPSAGPNSTKIVNGYDVTILIDLCKAIINAEAAKRLQKRYKNIAEQAHIIVGASAKAGIRQLVYLLSGYDATREDQIAAFKFYIREEARDYAQEFPPQLYREWYRLYQLPQPERNKPWKFKHLTVNHVYWPLARSSGRIFTLMKAQKAASLERNKKMHQFLSEIGVKTLRTHLGQILGIAQISDDKVQYEKYINKVFGEQMELDI